jgi:flagellin
MPIDSIGGLSSINLASSNIQQASERIASGSKINSAADDAAGFSISNRLTSQIEEFSQSARNANDGISYLQVAEGGLSSITQNVDRIRELTLQASNGTLNSSDRQALNAEAQQLRDEIIRTVENTTFNGQNVLTSGDTVKIQTGGGKEDSVNLDVDNFAAVLDNLNFSDLDISSSEGQQSALSALDSLQGSIDQAGAEIGASSNRLDSAINTLFSQEISASESRSRISDADFAKEISELTANDIREQAGIAVQAQANENGKGVLRLLGSL